MFPDGGISAVGQWTCLLGTQPSDIELISTECLSPCPTVKISQTIVHKFNFQWYNYFSLGLEGAESVLDNTPDNLRIIREEIK